MAAAGHRPSRWIKGALNLEGTALSPGHLSGTGQGVREEGQVSARLCLPPWQSVRQEACPRRAGLELSSAFAALLQQAPKCLRHGGMRWL